ncbi:MAG: ATP-binding protein [Methylococcales bacterium]
MVTKLLTNKSVFQPKRVEQFVEHLIFAIILAFSNVYAAETQSELNIIKPLLTQQENAFLKSKESIRFCINEDNMPLQGFDNNGSAIGILVDLNQLLAKKIDKQIVTVRIGSPQDQEAKLPGLQICDAYSIVDPLGKNLSVNISQPFLQQAIVMAIANTQTAFYQREYLLDKRFAINKHVTFFKPLLAKYPHMQFIPVHNAKTGLAMVVAGRVYGYVDSLATLAFQIKKQGITGVKMADFLDNKQNHYYVLKKQQTELLSIINKAILSITPAERNNIISSWVAVHYQHKMVSYSIILWVVIILLLLFIGIGYFFKNKTSKGDLLEKIQYLSQENKRLSADLAEKIQIEKQSIRFAEMFSHEYRTPVSIISTNLDILDLKNNQSTLFIDSQIEKMRDATTKLIVLVETALDRENLASSHLIAVKVDFDFYQLVDEVSAEMKNNYPSRKLQITMSQRSCIIYADRKLLKIMLKNLIENAFKYSNNKLAVVVILMVEENRLFIKVIDKGIGIPAADIKHIFDKYHRASNTSNVSGIGLGLYLSKLIIAQHSGVITVICPPEGGTQIEIELPL